MKKHFTLIFTLFLLLLQIPASAQGEWKWANYWTGNDDPMSGNNPFNYIVRTAFDDDGNIYVFGSFGGNATLYDQNLSMHFSNNAMVVSANTQGIVLIKFDSLGNYLWSKAVKTLKNTTCKPYDMTIHNNQIIISGEYSFSPSLNEQLLFFDTLITEHTAASYPTEEHNPPYTFGAYSFFSLLDLDGNVLENHFLKTITRELHNGEGGQQPISDGNPGTRPVCVDSAGNIYIAVNRYYAGTDTMPFTLVIDEDSSKTYPLYLPGNSYEPNVINSVMLYKFTTNWELEWMKLLIDHTVGISPCVPIDTLNPNIVQIIGGMNIDENDCLYLSGYLYDIYLNEQNDQYPKYVYWDSIHFATIDDAGLEHFMPFVIKYNSSGEVLWANQAFVNNPPENSIPNSISWMDNYVHNNSIYLVGWTSHFDGTDATYYFDNSNNLLNTSKSTTYFVRFNKYTGDFERAGVVPGNKTNVSYGSPIRPAVINNHLIHMTRNFMIDNNYHLLCYYNTDGTFQKADTISHLYSPIKGGQNVIVNQQGSLLCDFITKQNLTFGNDFNLDFTDNQHFHAVIAYRYDPSILEPYPEDSTGIADRGSLSRAVVRAYPNPTTDKVIVEVMMPLEDGEIYLGDVTTNFTMKRVTVTDLTGKVVLQRAVSGTRTELDFSALPAGTYIITASGEMGEWEGKVVKK